MLICTNGFYELLADRYGMMMRRRWECDGAHWDRTMCGLRLAWCVPSAWHLPQSRQPLPSNPANWLPLKSLTFFNHFVIRFVAGMQALFQQRTRPQSSWWWRPREDNYISNGSWHVLASVSLEVRRCDAGWSPKVWTSWPIDAERWKDVLEHRLHRLDVVFPLELARQIVAGLPSGKLTVRYGKS